MVDWVGGLTKNRGGNGWVVLKEHEAQKNPFRDSAF